MKLISILILCLSQTGIFAQKTGQAKIDSILQTLPSAKEDSLKVKALNQICEIYLTSNPARAIGYADQALAIAKKIDWKKGIARVLNLKGLVVGDTGNNMQARVYFQMSYDIQKQIENKSGMITSLNNIGRNYQRESDFSSALDYYFKALSIAEEIKSDEQIALVGTNLTASYLTQGNYTKGMEYGEMTLQHAETAHSLANIGKALQLMGNARMHQKDTAAAKDYLTRALKVYQEMDNPSAIAHVLSDMAELEYPNYTKELELMLRAQKLLDEVSPTSYASIGNLGNLGVTYSDLGSNSGPAERKAAFDKAEYYLNRAVRVCKENGNTEYLATLYGNISSLDEQRGHYKSALENLKSNFFINDSLFSQDKKNELASMENKHNIDLKNKEIEVSQLELASQRKTKIGLISGLALLAVIGGLLLWQNQMRKKSNTTLMVLNNQLDEANKVKAKFFGILSHDLRSPTSSLINFLHLLKNEPELLSASERSLYQQQIAESTQELLQTMETMLIWSKEQMDNFKPQIRIVQVSDLFEYLQKFFAHTTQIRIVFNNPELLEVSSDENYLKVIMQNLTSNAIKALKNNPDGTIIWKARKEGIKTILSITDNGPGIHADQIKALYNEEMAVNAKTGFGFHMIRDLAKAIQYHISIESKPGIGTTFVLSA
jgi:signal transduction histidine kinase/tetratricopeptide (TPR) repeat protein